jgi:hypothetical protein
MVTKKYRQTLNIRYIMPQLSVNVTKRLHIQAS